LKWIELSITTDLSNETKDLNIGIKKKIRKIETIKTNYRLTLILSD